MKATDLMLGDWVLCDGEPYQVAEISAGLLCIDAERALFATPEDLQPIPLTPEILEKNGWKRIPSEDTEVWYIFGLVLRKSEEYEGAYLWGLSVYVRSAHELQHLVRVLQIEKEIVL